MKGIVNPLWLGHPVDWAFNNVKLKDWYIDSIWDRIRVCKTLGGCWVGPTFFRGIES